MAGDLLEYVKLVLANTKSNQLKIKNFLLIASKADDFEAVKYLLSEEAIKKIKYINKQYYAPEETDELNHNIIYYSIKNSNADILDYIICNWPENYFTLNSTNLEILLSQSYNEILQYNIQIKDNIKCYINKKLLTLRFFTKPSSNLINCNFILDKLNALIKNIAAMDGNKDLLECIYILRCIAQDIYVLKRIIKCSYNCVPWEEMEFCIVIFLYFFKDPKTMQIIFGFNIFNIKRLRFHLNNFVKLVESFKDKVMEIDEENLKVLPNTNRKEAIKAIVNLDPLLQELYKDFHQLRDIYSLNSIYNAIELSNSVDGATTEGQLIMCRSLQITGENLKYTFESPKLSLNTSDMIMMCLPSYIKKMMIELRNEISHSSSLSKRLQLQEHIDVFKDLQSDLKNVQQVVKDLLIIKKKTLIHDILKEMSTAQSKNDYEDIVSFMSPFTIGQTGNPIMPFEFQMDSSSKNNVLDLFKELDALIKDKTENEKKLILQLYPLLDRKLSIPNIYKDYFGALVQLNYILISRNDFEWNKAFYKTHFHKILMNPEHSNNSFLSTNSNCFKLGDTFRINAAIEMINDLQKSAKDRMSEKDNDKMNMIVHKIITAFRYIYNNPEGLEEFWTQLRKKQKIKPSSTTKKTTPNLDQLGGVIDQMKNLLNDYGIELTPKSKYFSWISLNKLKAALELLLLDLLSILELNASLTNNLEIVDEIIFTLRGKCLRNHLAHENLLFDYLNESSFLSVILENVIKYCTEPISSFFRRQNDMENLIEFRKNDRDNDLIVVRHVMQFFTYMQHGNLDGVKSYIANGIDISSRYLTDTALHYAAKSNNSLLIKFLLDNGVFKDDAIECEAKQSPLHVAAECGQRDSLVFLLQYGDISVDQMNCLSRTPLHLAALKGHNDIVSILIKNNADIRSKDVSGDTPVHFAAKHNHKRVLLTLLEKESHVDDNLSLNNFTTLHMASEDGLTDIVRLLIKRGADVNKKTDTGHTPLLGASFMGHYDVVKTLIDCGADVNCRSLNGITPLQNAAEMGYEKLVELLLLHGAKVNLAHIGTNTTPLDYAASNGHVKVVKILLQHNADVNNICLNNGIIPLRVNYDFSKYNMNALGLAVWFDQFDVVKALIEHGVNIDEYSDKCIYPLHLSVLTGSVQISEFLLENNNQLVHQQCSVNGLSPLHLACLTGHVEIAQLLLNKGASVSERDNSLATVLHLAAYHPEILKIIIKNSVVCVNTLDIDKQSPLSYAVKVDSLESVDILLENGANVNVNGDLTLSPLAVACGANSADIAQLLINHGSDVSVSDILFAVLSGHDKIVKLFLKQNITLIKQNLPVIILKAVENNKKHIIRLLLDNFKTKDYTEIWNNSFYSSCARGFKGLVKLLITHGVNVNSRMTLTSMSRVTTVNFLHDKDSTYIMSLLPIHIACIQRESDIVNILLQNGACINERNSDGETPLCIASYRDNSGEIVSNLLKMGADFTIPDNLNRTPFELAVGFSRLSALQSFMKYAKVNVNSKNKDGLTPLHIAAQEGHFEVTRILVNNKAKITSRDDAGSMPIHIAAREGHLNLVQYFIKLGIDIMELGAFQQTLLHFASAFGHINVINYLLESNALVNKLDKDERSCLCYSVWFGQLEATKLLIQAGCYFNTLGVQKALLHPKTLNPNIHRIISATENLFKAVKRNNETEVKACIKAGAIVDTKDLNSSTPLHLAAWKGYLNIVNILLHEQCNVNVTGKNGQTPLHYAVKFSHYQVVLTLLLNGAFYNAVTDTGKSPLSLSSNIRISKLLSLIDNVFENIKNRNVKVLNILSSINDNSAKRAIFAARNSCNHSVVASALLNDFQKIGYLENMYQDVSKKLLLSQTFLSNDKHDEALRELNDVLKIRREMFYADDPSVLEVEKYIAFALYSKQEYNKALDLLNSVLRKYENILGENHARTLNCLSLVSLILHRLDRNSEALDICKKVYQKQKNLLGLYDHNVIETGTNYVLILNSIGEYEKALIECTKLANRQENTLGFFDPTTLVFYNNLGMTYYNLGLIERAIQIYEQVYSARVKVLGKWHSDTMRTMHNILIAQLMIKNPNAMKRINKFLEEQKSVLGVDHVDVLYTQINISRTLMQERNFIQCLTLLKECYRNCHKKYGKTHPLIEEVSELIKKATYTLSMGRENFNDILQRIHNDLMWAISNGDEEKTKDLLSANDGSINERDPNGKTLLHIAVNTGKISIVKILLDYKADVTLETNKGNTCLHLAVSKPVELTQMLLQNVSQAQMYKFVNTKTKLNGTTALHQAAKLGRLDQVKVLLQHGAIYNILDKNNKTPLDFCRSDKIRSILYLIDSYFVMKNSPAEEMVIEKMRSLEFDAILCLTNTRSRHGQTLVTKALNDKKYALANFLLSYLKNIN